MSQLDILVEKAKVYFEKGDMIMFDRVMYKVFLILSNGNNTGTEG